MSESQQEFRIKPAYEIFAFERFSEWLDSFSLTNALRKLRKKIRGQETPRTISPQIRQQTIPRSTMNQLRSLALLQDYSAHHQDFSIHFQDPNFALSVTKMRIVLFNTRTWEEINIKLQPLLRIWIVLKSIVFDNSMSFEGIGRFSFILCYWVLLWSTGCSWLVTLMCGDTWPNSRLKWFPRP